MCRALVEDTLARREPRWRQAPRNIEVPAQGKNCGDQREIPYGERSLKLERQTKIPKGPGRNHRDEHCFYADRVLALACERTV
eukprot:1189837-Prorocentrum_minimum.AAC.2